MSQCSLMLTDEYHVWYQQTLKKENSLLRQ